MSKQPALIIKEGIRRDLARYVKPLGTTCTIITDSNLRKEAESLRSTCKKHGLTVHCIVIPAGEKSKAMTTVEEIIRSLARLGLKRDSVLIALGGGVVGDIAGFIASIYMRGIPYIMMPTTLLAMADSSIGGKTGVDIPEGKNLIGTFYHPRVIISDPYFLRSLSDKAFREGMAEIIKHAVIRDRTLFHFLEKNAGKIMARTGRCLLHMLKRSAAIKRSIVAHDEKESLRPGAKGISRMSVNYGHTVGHALERLSNYEIPHGEAVSIGMVAENCLAVDKGLLKEPEAVRIKNLLKLFGLPIAMPAHISPHALKKAVMTDKKHIDGKLFFALPTRIGGVEIVHYDFA